MEPFRDSQQMPQPYHWACETLDAEQFDVSVGLTKLPGVWDTDTQFAPLPDDQSAGIAADDPGLYRHGKNQRANDKWETCSRGQGIIAGSDAAIATDRVPSTPFLQAGEQVPNILQWRIDDDFLSYFHAKSNIPGIPELDAGLQD